ncbi:MAG TPA: hypothetical protein VGF55_20110 [Gemmataceae bacterium]|jgi:hypothetical protein
MDTAGLRRGLLVIGALVAATPACRAVEPLVTNYGIGTILHPLQPAAVAPCNCPKEHIYIFAVNGVNPLCLGNFNGFCNYLKDQGYCHTYFAQLYTCPGWSDRIREVRRCDPQAKIVLIGFSMGANWVKAIANDLAQDCTRVDLLVYIVGDTLQNTPASHPANVCRILNIRGKGLILTGGDLIWNGCDIDGARNCKVECRHILAPSRRETLELVTEELAALACGTPPPAGCPCH